MRVWNFKLQKYNNIVHFRLTNHFIFNNVCVNKSNRFNHITYAISK